MKTPRTRQETSLHSKSSVIPLAVWNHFFGKNITRKELKLMRALPKARIDTGKCIREHLCVLYGHPSITADKYLTILKPNRSTIQDAAIAAVVAGRVDILKLIDRNGRPNFNLILEHDNFNLLGEAARFSTLSVVQFLVCSYSGDIRTLLKADSYNIFRAVAYRNNLQIKIFDYLLSRAPELKNEIIINRQFDVFRSAAGGGNISFLKYLLQLCPALVEHMLAAKNYEAFSRAAALGKISRLKFLLSLAPEKNRLMAIGDNYKAFREAATHGKINVLRYMLHLLPNELSEMVGACFYKAFYNAAVYSDSIRCLNYIIKLIPNKTHLIESGRFKEAFHEAARHGREKIFERLMEYAPKHCSELIEFSNYKAFREAAEFGRINVLKLLVKILPCKVKEMVSAEDFYAFRRAALYGNLQTLNYLISLYPGATKKMVAANSCEAFSNAASFEKISILKKILVLEPDIVSDFVSVNTALHRAVRFSSVFRPSLRMIKYLIKIAGQRASEMVISNDYEIFKEVSHLKLLKYLLSIIPEHKEQAIKANKFALFKNSVVLSKLDILKYLVALAPSLVPNIIASEDFRVFFVAAYINYDTEVMRFLLKLAPNQKQAMIEAGSFSAFAHAAGNQGNNINMQYLAELVPEKLEIMISSNDFAAFREAVHAGNLSNVKYLLHAAPVKIKKFLVAHPELIKDAIYWGYIDVVDFLLGCSAKLLYQDLFICGRAPRLTMGEDWASNFNGFFENPTKLSPEEKNYLIASFLTLGYFEIAKSLILKFWGANYHLNSKTFITELLMQARDYPDRLEDFLEFLVLFMNWNKKTLKELLNQMALR